MNTSLTFSFILILKIYLVNSGIIIHGTSKVNKNVKVFFSPSLQTAYQYKLENFHKILSNKYFNRNLHTAIYVHGFYDDGEKDFSSMALRGAYRERNDTNFLTIDWQHYSKCFLYKNVVIPQLKIICEAIALNLKNFLDAGYDVHKLHLVGHSLGGHCIGLAARHLKGNSQYIIPRLYALDPAGPGFEKDNYLSKILRWVTFTNTNFEMISRSDADYVQIIHTNAGKYGITRSRGHADFFPNAGMKQNGCELEFLADNVCSHRRAWVFYQESVFPTKPFLAIQCDSYENFKNGKCKDNQITQMGFSNSTDGGNFYLITHSNPLHTSLGEEGIKYIDFNVITEDGTTRKPLIMSDSKLKWEKSIEFEKLLIVDENNEVTEKTFVKFSSPSELMGDDFEFVSDSSSSLNLDGGCLLILTILYTLEI